MLNNEMIQGLFKEKSLFFTACGKYPAFHKDYFRNRKVRMDKSIRFIIFSYTK